MLLVRYFIIFLGLLYSTTSWAYLEDENIECEIVEDNGEANDYPLLARKAYQLFLEKNAIFL